MDKCLAFCQALAKSNHKFSLNLTIDKDNFNFNNKELATSSWQMKKKKSPSQLRREAKRREEHEKKVAGKVADKDIPSANETVKVAEKKVIYEEAESNISLTKDILKVSDENAEDSLNPSEEVEATMGFKCDQCSFESVSDKGLRQHIRIKHRISQVDGADEIEPDEEDKVKGSSKHIYEVKLDSNEHHVGQGTPQLSEFLEEPPDKVNHPEHGVGVFVEIDKDWGTFIYQFDGIKSEV